MDEGAGGRRGHRASPHTADCALEAWGPDRCSCLVEALEALVEVFAERRATAPTRVLALRAEGSDEDVLTSLLEEVVYVTDALGVVPVAFNLSEDVRGGVSGDMEVVDPGDVTLVGPVPKGVSYYGLRIAEADGCWRCRAVVDV